MKVDKLIDAIGMIDDEYIEKAHEKRKGFSFNRATVMKLAAAAVCVLLAVTILPEMFARKGGMGSSNSTAYVSEYQYATDAAAPGESYKPSDEEAQFSTSETSGESQSNSSETLKKDKKLILTGNLDLETQNINDILSKLLSNVDKCGGYIQRSSTFTRGNDTRVYEATIRIPADQYQSFLNDAQGLGNVVSYSQEVKDITDSYTDIEARLNSLKAQEQKVLEFYKSANTIEDLMAVEERLSQIRYEIEYYENTIKNYDLLVAYSTLHVTIQETKVYTPTSTGFFTRLANSFKNGFTNFIDNIGDFIIELVYNIWTILLLIAIAYLVYRLYRYFQNRKFRK